jgi:glycosyltransferase involved in cell wall biosynthesis
MADVALRTALRARRITQVLRKERSRVLVVCSGDLVDLPAGFIAARSVRIPLLAYMFDDYRNQHYHHSERVVAGMFERVSLRGARSLIVPNEFAADEYAARYGVTPRIVRNMVDELHLNAAPQTTWPRSSGEVRVVYAGGIYPGQPDSFVRLMGALAAWDLPERVTLHLYSAQTRAQIEACGIPPGVTMHQHVPGEEVPAVLRQADVLFLPLSFSSGIPEVIRTSSPGKFGEYLASGAPILAHTPRDSFLTWYIRKHNCGVVCDSPDATALRLALARLVSDSELRSTVTANAVACARRDFNPQDAWATFAHALRDAV